jgi:hypothetical protein
MKKPLLVCSVYCGSENRNVLWMKLQHTYLRRTVGSNYDHAVYLNAADRALFKESTVIGESQNDGGGPGHLVGLKAVREYCLAHDYEHYLILDSDSFPIAEDWLEVLSSALFRMQKLYAAPLRVENLDTFPHPCVFFTKDPECIQFEFVPGTNLLGRETNDITCVADRKHWLPMFKTNRVSRHPTIGSVYYDSFYHHGCGSRAFVMRAVLQGYYDSMIPKYPSFDALTNELIEDPEAYLRSLQLQACVDPPGRDRSLVVKLLAALKRW